MLSDWFSNLAEVMNTNLYAILDAARDDSILTKLSTFSVEAVSLYRGEPEETLATVAPYLVDLGRNTSLTRWLVTAGWGQSWGILLTSPNSIEELRRHFRHFLLVRNPEGNELYFRFYDPRVLRVYLPTCTAPETQQFFGPITAFFLESEDASEVLEFTRVGLRSIATSALGTASAVASPHPEADVTRTRPINGRIKIRQDQMRAFSEYMDRSFEQRATRHLRAEYPAETTGMSDDQLCAFVQEGSGKAAKYELNRETEIGLFLDLLMLFRADFDQGVPWAKDILESSYLSSEQKVERLREFRNSELERRKRRDE